MTGWKMMAVCGVGVLALVGASCDSPKVERGAEVGRFNEQIKARTAATMPGRKVVLTLGQCEKIALANNLDLSVQRLTLRIQDDRVRESMTGFLPKFDLKYVAHARSNAPLISQNGMTVAVDDQRQQNLAISGTIPVLDYGLTYYAYRTTKDQREQQRLLYTRAQQELIRDVRVAYARHASALRMEGITRRNVEAAHQVLRLAQTLEREQLAAPAETAVFRAAMAQTEVELTLVKQRVAETRLDLAELLAFPLGVEFAIDSALPTLPVAPEGAELAKLEDHALRVRPELRAQDLTRHISANAVKSQVAAMLPRIDGIGSFNWTSNSFMVNPAYFLYGLQVTNALLEGGAQIFRYSAAKKTVTVEEERTLLLSLGVLYEVEMRAVQLQRLQETVAAQDVSERARQEAFNRILSLYKEGLENEAGTAKALTDLNGVSLALDTFQTNYQVKYYEFLAAALPEVPDPTRPATTQPGTQPASQPATKPASSTP